MSYQLPGTSSSGLSPEKAQPTSRISHNTSYRQLDDSGLHNKKGGKQITISERCEEVDSEIVNQEELEFICSSPKWNPECSSRFIVTSGASVYEIETG